MAKTQTAAFARPSFVIRAFFVIRHFFYIASDRQLCYRYGLNFQIVEVRTK
jgi:hypothetical protein